MSIKAIKDFLFFWKKKKPVEEADAAEASAIAEEQPVAEEQPAAPDIEEQPVAEKLTAAEELPAIEEQPAEEELPVRGNISAEETEFPGNGLPPMPGVHIKPDSEQDKLEIYEAPGPEGEILTLGDLIPEEGLPIPEYRSEQPTEEAPEDAPVEALKETPEEEPELSKEPHSEVEE